MSIKSPKYAESRDALSSRHAVAADIVPTKTFQVTCMCQGFRLEGAVCMMQAGLLDKCLS